MTLSRRLAVVACCLAATSGCAILTAPPQTDPGVANPAAWRERQARLADITQWSLQGRAASGKLLGWTGNISWRQRGEEFTVRVSGPLGAGGFLATGTLDRVTIRTEDETVVTENPEALVREAVGWAFPLSGLRYWVLGLPAPATPAKVTVDEQGLLVGLEQSGWRLGYPEYVVVDGLKLPKEIVLYNGENTIEVVIDRWFGVGGG